jgi:hypothetical protein
MGRSGNPGGRRRGSRNKATLAAAALLAGESEALTRGRDGLGWRPDGDAALHGTGAGAVAGTHCRVRLSALKVTSTAEACGPTAQDVSLAMNAVTSALAQGEISPGEAEKIAGVVDTFVRAIEATKKDSSRLNLLQILTAGDYDDDNAEDDPDEGGFEENGDYENADERN